MGLPCCTRTAIQEDFKKKIFEVCNKRERSSDEDIEIVKILAPLTDNPNAPNNWGETPSSVAENKEIHRFLKSFNSSRKRNAGPMDH